MTEKELVLVRVKWIPFKIPLAFFPVGLHSRTRFFVGFPSLVLPRIPLGDHARDCPPLKQGG